MKSYLKNINIILFLVFLTACASNVRFTSESKQPNVSCVDEKFDERPEKKAIEIEKIEKNESQISSKQEQVIKIAHDWLGTPYLWGGNTRKGVDCSGFVKNVYQEVGINLPRTAQMQFDYSYKISKDKIKPGDLLFYRKNGKITHVAIYVGKGEIIHSSTGRGVIKQPITDDYLSSIFAGAGRVLD